MTMVVEVTAVVCAPAMSGEAILYGPSATSTERTEKNVSSNEN